MEEKATLEYLPKVQDFMRTRERKLLDDYLRAHEIDWKMVGRNIKEGRELRGVTQAYLVNRLGGDRGQTYKYENGIVPVSTLHMARIIDLLKLPLGWFMGDKKIKASVKRDKEKMIKEMRRLLDD